MLFGENSGGESFRRVVVQDRNNRLLDNRAGIQTVIDEVDRATGDFGTMFESLMLGIQTWKRGQKRWVNIENAHRKFAKEIAAQNAHVACETDQLHAVLVQLGHEGSIVNFAIKALGRERHGVEAPFTRVDYSGSLGSERIARYLVLKFHRARFPPATFGCAAEPADPVATETCARENEVNLELAILTILIMLTIAY